MTVYEHEQTALESEFQELLASMNVEQLREFLSQAAILAGTDAAC